MPKENQRSWLSPRRRRTTGNLKAIPNGQVRTSSSEAAPTSSTIDENAVLERPASTQRAISQPTVPLADGDGNLFYAYARKGDDLKSRYLLTFASASIANEWWLLLQANFSDASRPGPQLFSFKTDDLLSKAWSHPSFAHLKSKWMYISFSDAPGDGIGGAAQGIIPVQDEHGNMMGGSEPSSAQFAKEVKAEAKSVKNEVHKLEEYFERMMSAVERNTEKVADLAEKRKNRTSHDETIDALSQASGKSDIGSVDMGMLAGHFVRMNDLLSKNSQHVEALTKKHYENEAKLSQTIEALKSAHTAGDLDLDRLSSHLDRIQSMMEASAIERKDSAKELPSEQGRSIQIDFSPLTDRLEKVQEAVEQNSALIKTLLEEGNAESKQTTPFWGKDQTTQPDLLPLTQHLQRIHDAIEQQSEQIKAQPRFDEEVERRESDVLKPTLVAPLSEHLEQIYNAIEEGNRHAREAPKLDLQPLTSHLQALRSHFKSNAGSVDRLVASQDATREAVETNGGEIDFTPMVEYLEAIRESSDTHTETVKQLLESQEATRKESIIDLTPLKEHLSAVRKATDRNSEHMRKFVESQQASATSNRSPKMDFTPLTERLNQIHSTLEKQGERQDQSEGIGDSKFIMNALTSHLSKIQSVTEQNAKHVKALREKQSSSQDKMHIAVSETSEQVRSLTQRTQENENRIDAQNSQMRELMSGQREMVDVMRQLAKSVVAQSKGSCDHVVVPPPRKMGRKVVGFVYDTKEGTPSSVRSRQSSLEL